jgi:hypothetical protein
MSDGDIRIDPDLPMLKPPAGGADKMGLVKESTGEPYIVVMGADVGAHWLGAMDEEVD